MFWLAEVFNGSHSQQEMRRLERWAHRQRAEDVHTLFVAVARGAVIAVKASIRTPITAARWAAQGYRRFTLWQRRRAAIRELKALGDHVLRDIGLVRGDIPQVVDAMLSQEVSSPAQPRRPVLRPVQTRRAVSGDPGEHDWQRAA